MTNEKVEFKCILFSLTIGNNVIMVFLNKFLSQTTYAIHFHLHFLKYIIYGILLYLQRNIRYRIFKYCSLFIQFLYFNTRSITCSQIISCASVFFVFFSIGYVNVYGLLVVSPTIWVCSNFEEGTYLVERYGEDTCFVC